MPLMAELETIESQANPRIVNYPGPKPGLEFSFRLHQVDGSYELTFFQYVVAVSYQVVLEHPNWIGDLSKVVFIGNARLTDLQRSLAARLTPQNETRWKLVVPLNRDVLSEIEQTRRYAKDGAVTFGRRAPRRLRPQHPGRDHSCALSGIRPKPHSHRAGPGVRVCHRSLGDQQRLPDGTPRPHRDQLQQLPAVRSQPEHRRSVRRRRRPESRQADRPPPRGVPVAHRAAHHPAMSAKPGRTGSA